VLLRLVPLHRGLFEDYVANFWCATHCLFKWKLILSQSMAVRLCMYATLVGMTPACMHQLLRPSRRGFLFCLLNTSLSFFLFSYQVLPPCHCPIRAHPPPPVES
jgi:alpha-1,3-glucosyltransferase